MNALAADGLAARAEVSVKLTAVGQLLDEDLALRNAGRLAAAAERAGTTVTRDMADHTTTDSTLGILRELRQEGYENVVRETDPLGQVTQLERTGMGVAAKLRTADGAVWSATYTSKERLRALANPRGETHAFEYDTAGRVIAESAFDGRATRYAYAPSGRVSRIEYADQSRREFAYDRLGNLTEDRGSDGEARRRRHER